MSTHRTSNNFDWHGDDQRQSCSHVGQPYVGLRGEVYVLGAGAKWEVFHDQSVALPLSDSGEAQFEVPIAQGHTHAFVDAMACVEEYILQQVEDARRG